MRIVVYDTGVSPITIYVSKSYDGKIKIRKIQYSGYSHLIILGEMVSLSF